MKTAIVCISNGSEELETISIIDSLRRGNINVIVTKILDKNEEEEEKPSLECLCSRNAKIVADKFFSKELLDKSDLISLPGGMGGAKTFASSKILINSLKEKIENVQKNKKKEKFIVSAICASPAIVLGPNGFLSNIKQATCYPSLQKKLPQHLLKSQMKKIVVVDEMMNKFDGNGIIKVITSQGPCTAVSFGIELIKQLIDQETAQKVAKGMLL